MEKHNGIKQVCKNFMYKNCQREDCKFIHDNTICFYYWKHGSCKFQSECKKTHDVVLQPMTCRQGDDKGNDKGNYKGNYKGNGKGDVKGYVKGDVKGYSKGDVKGNVKGDVKGNDKGDGKGYSKGDVKGDGKGDGKGDVKGKRNKDKYNNKKKKNTECFVPKTDPVDVRVVLDLRSTFIEDCAHCAQIEPIPELTSRDILLSPKLFDDFGKYEIYNKLVSEIENCEIPETELLKLWHGNDKIEGTHLIADDHRKWKEHCPTFNMVISRLKQVFKMDIKATRFNWYRDPDHWKPFHHDAAAVKVDKALTQNFTVAVSFGATKDAAFEHAKTKTVISIPQPDGTIYSFTNDTNGIWRHGILQDKREQELGRISIIAWGWVDNVKQILQ